MKFKRIFSLLILSSILLVVSACTTATYTIGSTITGTIEEFITEEKFLFDDQFLLVKEYGGESEGRSPGNEYEIPVDSFEGYEIGQNVEVVIYSNTDADVWDLDNLKFEITILD